eukprot:Colp12_sorted_trinity150504_noHs@10160
MQPRTLANFINGEFVEPSTNAYIDDVNPATNIIVARVPRSNEDDVNKATAAAKAAFPAWSKLPINERAKYLQAMAAKIEERIDEMAALESADTGKPLWLAKAMDMSRSAANLRFFSEAAPAAGTDSYEMADALNYTQRSPVGVAGLITPWNLPLYLLTWKVAPALIMGNTIVAKPSEFTPQTAHALCEIAQAIGLPKGVLNMVHGFGHEAGQAIVAHQDISLISFTGGTVTGRLVAQTAASMFKKLSLELGGKNATIIFDDCDLELTLAGAVRSSFLNQGQICLCGSRNMQTGMVWVNCWLHRDLRVPFGGVKN